MTLRDGIRRLASRVRLAKRSRIAAAIVILPLAVFAFASAGPVGATPQPAGMATRYSVQPGDTLWKIAIRYDTTVDALVKANRIADRNLIFPGEVVWVPSSEQAAEKVVAQVSSPKPVFPLPGYRGRVGKHWGTFEGSSGAADLFAPEGTPILAVMGGRVVSAGWSARGGWNAWISGTNGLQYYYAHMRQRPSVAAGAYVVTGQHIGFLGATGDAAAPHLHIAIGPQISVVGNAEGLRPGYGINFDASAYLNKLL